MPAQINTVYDYGEFKSLVDKLDSNNEKVILYIVGGKINSGKSWCTDCQEAEPIIDEYIKSKVKKAVNIVRVELERTYYKDRKNPFRLCNTVRLEKVPSLICWKDVKRLEESECNNVALLDMFFEDFLEK